MGRLQDRIAVITGGTSGIGRAIAVACARDGAHVIVIGTSQQRGEEVVKEIAALSSSVHPASFQQVDVTDHLAVHSAMEHVFKQHGAIDLLVNAAGITRDNLLLRMKEEEWDQVMTTNVKSCYNTCHAVVREMMKRRKGVIVNVGSIIGTIGNAGQANYAASKAALVGLTKSLAKELAPRQIRVNLVAPGFIATKMTDVLSEKQKEAILSQIPLQRIGQPEEIAAAVLFLASDEAAFITGQVLTVDGGMAI